ncbi:2-dehydro-3-deoxyphosphogluconate aldolase/(4S)-4-hydroxy-2-oxoglutarate aldolase [Actinomadura pelletieri DSM 43383]|uniref:2-dehydro-3-deoxy-phosphogluconate aldolase n=1 Tax=Actinomadura pelletieri DSM 43383 TaxID=1120940 RepID=A0A495QBI9_9ACTN|nr:bifunctional 4-hydroxy-2-oxoglutarate aldolase/2-dehydro-3-deoxy-phosphogluconate aldolase [Actinomadura pelletieri]RKS68856.1 2-dehydro-3-deoxyphosphogluconate aldolase/(4S)-4-hydroxy-2-oxoglutarate aldolase [Actinomadura pelletieri DSM 43383]
MIADDLFDLAPVIPVVVLDDVDAAVPLARALVDGGLPVVEVTLRTPQALAAIARIAAEVPDAVVGAGTVVRPQDAERSAAAGARFLVSPGRTPRLQDAMVATGLPFLPGVATASEVVALLEDGITAMKFFPAEASGGTAFLKSLGGPLPQARFCPTGGIGPGNAAEYLALENVGCVGGSWTTPADAIRDGDWDRVRALASEAAALRAR